jgi:hypothetical protein
MRHNGWPWLAYATFVAAVLAAPFRAACITARNWHETARNGANWPPPLSVFFLATPTVLYIFRTVHYYRTVPTVPPPLRATPPRLCVARWPATRSFSPRPLSLLVFSVYFLDTAKTPPNFGRRCLAAPCPGHRLNPATGRQNAMHRCRPVFSLSFNLIQTRKSRRHETGVAQPPERTIDDRRFLPQRRRPGPAFSGLLSAGPSERTWRQVGWVRPRVRPAQALAAPRSRPADVAARPIADRAKPTRARCTGKSRCLSPPRAPTHADVTLPGFHPPEYDRTCSAYVHIYSPVMTERCDGRSSVARVRPASALTLLRNHKRDVKG